MSYYLLNWAAIVLLVLCGVFTFWFAHVLGTALARWYVSHIYLKRKELHDEVKS